MVRLLETTLIRVGNDEYAKANKTFGLTTLRNRHVEGRGHRAALPVPRQVRQAAQRHAAQTAASPGSCAGCRSCRARSCSSTSTRTAGRQPIDSGDVNAYLREIAGEDFTAKDFRTWVGDRAGRLGAERVRGLRQPGRRQAQRHPGDRRGWPARLGNTPAICRKSYVHPEILGAYLDGSLIASLRCEIEEQLRQELDGLEPEEVAVLVLLQQRLAQAAPTAEAA